MSSIKVIIWLFPILFIFHDFEEIIFMKIWIIKNRCYLSERFPGLSDKLLPHFDNITTSSFTLGVAEEFIIIIIITTISYLTDWYLLWAGFFIAFSLHLVIHCFQALIIKKYVPAVITSLICLFASFFIFKNIVQLFQSGAILLYSFISIIIMAGNLVVIHKVMEIFSKWSAKYERLDK